MRLEKLTGLKLVVCLALVAAAAFIVMPRTASLRAQGHVRIPLATDWSHRHLVYSAPSSLEQTMRLRQDSRYIQQYVRRNVSMKTPWAPQATEQLSGQEVQRDFFRRERTEPSDIHRDWSENLGSGASVGLNQFPAKYSFDTTTANCDDAAQPDFVAYNTSLAGTAPAEASGTGTFSGNPTNGQTFRITNGANIVTLTASLSATATASITINSRPAAGNTVTVGATTYTFENAAFICGFVTNCVVSSTTDATTATNLTEAINDTCAGGVCRVSAANASASATSAGAVVSLTALAIGAGGNGIALSSNPASGTGAGHPFLDVGFSGGVTGSNTGTNFSIGGGATSDATNLASAINRNNATIGVNAASAGGVVTITASTIGPAGNAIALAETMTNFTISGATLAGGTNGQASIVAYDNLYTGCPTTSKTVPAVYFQYDTGGTVVTSISLSGDGSQLAFVQTQGGVATLVLLKWSSNPALTALTGVSNAAYQNCTAPCMTTIAFHNNPTDTNSSPFYVFDGTQADTLYAGDNNGQLHKFHPVFGGTPAEVTTAWPITVNATAGTIMTGPVYDNTSGNIFITDSRGDLSYVRDVGSTVGTCTAPCKGASIDVTQGGGYPIEDSPIVDSTSQRVFVFTDCSLAGDAGGTCGDSTSPAQVIQTNTALAAEVQANIGISSAFNNVHAGSFDNNYYSGSFGSGRLYTCGNPGRTHDPFLYILSFNSAGVMSPTVVTGPALGTSGMNNQCSPITEAYNANAVGGATDWIYVSVLIDGSPATCAAGGCLMNFFVTAWQANTAYVLNQEIVDTRGNVQQVTTAGTSGGAAPAWSATTGGVTNGGGTLRWTNRGLMAIANAIAAPGGTSGIIIDNTVSTTGGLSGVSQVYYSTLANGTCATSGGTGGCAVQASQAALH